MGRPTHTYLQRILNGRGLETRLCYVLYFSLNTNCHNVLRHILRYTYVEQI